MKTFQVVPGQWDQSEESFKGLNFQILNFHKKSSLKLICLRASQDIHVLSTPLLFHHSPFPTLQKKSRSSCCGTKGFLTPGHRLNPQAGKKGKRIKCFYTYGGSDPWPRNAICCRAGKKREKKNFLVRIFPLSLLLWTYKPGSLLNFSHFPGKAPQSITASSYYI